MCGSKKMVWLALVMLLAGASLSAQDIQQASMDKLKETAPVLWGSICDEAVALGEAPAGAFALVKEGWDAEAAGDPAASEIFGKAKAAAGSLVASPDARNQAAGHLALSEVAFAAGDYNRSIVESKASITTSLTGRYSGDMAPIDLTSSYAQESSFDQAARAKLYLGLGYEMIGLSSSSRVSFRQVLYAFDGAKASAEAEYRVAEAKYTTNSADVMPVRYAVDELSTKYPGEDKWCAWGEYLLGLQLAGIHHFSEARSAWEAIVDKYPGQADVALKARIAILEYCTEADKSVEELEKIVSEHPESAKAKRALAGVYMKLDRGDDVIRVASEIVSLYPAGASAADALAAQSLKGRCQLTKNDVDQAIASFEAAISYPVGFPASVTDVLDVRMKLAEAYGIAKENDKSIAELDAVKDNLEADNGRRASASYQKAMYLKYSGDVDGAKKALIETEEKFADTYLSVRAAERLAELEKQGS